VPGGDKCEYLAFPPTQSIRVSQKVGRTTPARWTAQRCQTLLSTARRRPRTQLTEGGDCRFHCADVATELRDGRLVRTAAAGPLGSGGLPVSADLKMVGRDRVADDGLWRVTGEVGPALQVTDDPRIGFRGGRLQPGGGFGAGGDVVAG
jgi:hypothetical protein